MGFKILMFLSFVLLARPQDLIPALQPLRLALTLTVLSAGTTFLGPKGRLLFPVLRLSETKKYVLFYLVMIAGIPFAYHRRIAFDFVLLTYLINVFFFLIFVLEVDSLKKLKIVLFVISLCTFFYSVSSLMYGAFHRGRFQIYGKMFDPNDIAYVLLSLFPLSFYFILHREGFLKRSVAIVSIVTALMVILYSGSRGGMLGLIAATAFFLLKKNKRVKISHKVLFIIAMTAIVFLIRDKIDVDRYLTLTDLDSDYNVTDEFGREQIWKRGFALLLSNPITGVGVNCFGMAIGYAREALEIVPYWQDAHSSFVQVAVETGIPGFILFVALIIQSLKTFSTFTKIQMTSPEAIELATISWLMQGAFIGQLVSAAFLTQGYSLFFTLVFAISAVMHRLPVVSVGAEEPRIRPVFELNKIKVMR